LIWPRRSAPRAACFFSSIVEGSVERAWLGAIFDLRFFVLLRKRPLGRVDSGIGGVDGLTAGSEEQKVSMRKSWLRF
jgi:hypothetical protein